mgnify:CR=1 FL=1
MRRKLFLFGFTFLLFLSPSEQDALATTAHKHTTVKATQKPIPSSKKQAALSPVQQYVLAEMLSPVNSLVSGLYTTRTKDTFLLVEPPSLPLPSEDNASGAMGAGYYSALGAFFSIVLLVAGIALVAEIGASIFAIAGLAGDESNAVAGWICAVIGGLGFIAGIPFVLWRGMRVIGAIWMVVQGAILALGIVSIVKSNGNAKATNKLEHGVAASAPSFSVLHYRTTF